MQFLNISLTEQTILTGIPRARLTPAAARIPQLRQPWYICRISLLGLTGVHLRWGLVEKLSCDLPPLTGRREKVHSVS